MTNLTNIQFIDNNGQRCDGQEFVVPILKLSKYPRIDCIGTGFFISLDGIIVTAAHVIEDFLDQDGKPPVDEDGEPIAGLGTIQFVPPNSIAFREIDYIDINKRADVAVVTAKPEAKWTGVPLRNKALEMTVRLPQVGEDVFTWGYPNGEFNVTDSSIKLFPKPYKGKVKAEHRKGRDRVMLPGPCYETDMEIPGGTSGGPVFDLEGRVFGINSTNIGGAEVSYVSHIQSIGGLLLPVGQSGDGKDHEFIKMCDLIHEGTIRVAHIERV